MENTQLIAVLRTLSKKEYREFSKWLCSPFFNQRKDVLDLFHYLIKADHLHESKFLDKERVFKKVFPRESYDDAKMRQSIHFLYKQLESYLTYGEFLEALMMRELLLAKVYRKRKLDKPFLRQVKQYYKEETRNEVRDTHLLRSAYELREEHTTFLNQQPKRVNINFRESINALDTYVIAEKLRQACYVLAHQKVFKSNYEFRLIEEILQLVKEEPSFLQEPNIAIFYHIYLMISRKDEVADQSFFEVRNMIEEQLDAFPKAMQTDIYLMALNYCVGRVNQGDFFQETFDMYRKGLDTGILVQNNRLSTIAYQNIVALGLRFKEYKWVEQFLEEYSPYLEESSRENFKQYSQARLYFELGDFERAMRLLNQFDSKHIIIHLNAKAMLLKMFYEQAEFDALESLLDSMRIYLRRKDILGYHKTNFQNIIKCTRRLVRINPFDKKAREKLELEIKETSPLTERPWLLEQVNKL